MSRLSERIENFNRAFEMFNRVHKQYLLDKSNETYQLALAQSFELIFELSWKVMKDFLKVKGITTGTPKDTIKQAFASNLLPGAQVWIDMINDRNFSVHEYNFKKINEILEKISNVYYNEIINFYNNIRGMLDEWFWSAWKNNERTFGVF